jgi:hypothetical protein
MQLMSLRNSQVLFECHSLDENKNIFFLDFSQFSGNIEKAIKKFETKVEKLSKIQFVQIFFSKKTKKRIRQYL